VVKRLWVANVLIGAMGLILLLAQFAGPAAWYYAGRTNRDSFAVLGMEKLLLLLAAAAICFGVLLVIALARLFQRRFRAAAYPAALLVLAVVLLFARPLLIPPDVYENGLRRWMHDHMTPPVVQDVRQWLAKLPPTTQAAAGALNLFEPAAPGEVPPPEWPASLHSLAPDRVIQVQDGLVLQWGNFGTWGSSRRVFITHTSAKPDDGSDHYDYQPAGECVWFAVQDQN
jgi:hypothetical protein